MIFSRRQLTGEFSCVARISGRHWGHAGACPNCGQEIGRRDTFCDSCGAFLGWEQAVSAESQLLPVRGEPRRDQRAAVQIQLGSDLIAVAPGNAESTAFTVKNLGTQVEEFRFFVTGPEWILADPAAIAVYPGQEATGAVQAAPPRTPGSTAGITPFRLTVTSAVHPNVSSSVAGRVDVATYHELAAELVPTLSSGRGLTRHHVRLDNRGNVPLRVGLSPTDVADGLRLGVPAFADVPPGQVIEVPVSARGSRRWIGRPEPKPFSVIAEAPKPLAAARLSGTRIVTPMFPRWVPAVAAGTVALGVAAVALAPQLAGGHGHGQPTTIAPPSSSPPATATSPPASSPSTSAPASSPPTSTPATSPSTTFLLSDLSTAVHSSGRARLRPAHDSGTRFVELHRRLGPQPADLGSVRYQVPGGSVGDGHPGIRIQPDASPSGRRDDGAGAGNRPSEHAVGIHLG